MYVDRIVERIGGKDIRQVQHEADSLVVFGEDDAVHFDIVLAFYILFLIQVKAWHIVTTCHTQEQQQEIYVFCLHHSYFVIGHTEVIS